MALLFSCFIGCLADRVNPSTILIFVFAVSAFGVLIFTQINRPEDRLTYLSVICFNIGNQC